MAEVTISLVTWNGISYLPRCLPSLLNQEEVDFELLIIDNNSQDGTVEWLKTNYPQVTLITNHENLGFTRAHNKGILWSKSEFLFLVNQDMVFDKKYLRELLTVIKREPQAASVSGCLYKWGRDSSQNLENPAKSTAEIDTLGLLLKPNHQIIELQTKPKTSNYFPVFGVSGAAPLYRRQALVDVAWSDPKTKSQLEFFDKSFHSYKEDVDLAYRFQLAGWKSFSVPQALAWHDRTLTKNKKLSFKEKRQLRKKRSAQLNYQSYRNHLFLLIKNTPRFVWKKLGWKIIKYETKKLGYVLLFEPGTCFKTIRDLVLNVNLLLKKRRQIQTTIKIKESSFWLLINNSHDKKPSG